MKKIVVLGGTFNPVHLEHVNLVKSAINELSPEKFLIMPTYMSPHKDTAPAPAEDRVNMLKLAFSGVNGVEICDYEITKGGTSYTYQTAEYLKSEYPNSQIIFLMGGDMLTDFKNWRYPERIMALADIAVFGREGFYTDYQAEEKLFLERFGKTFLRLNYVGSNFSSTKIRVYTAFNLSTANLTDRSVIDYIASKGLYKGNEYTEFVIKNLKPERVLHTANVVITALFKAKELKLEVGKVFTSATLHDCAKYLSLKDFPSFTIDADVPPPVVHAFLGAYVAEHVLNITDTEVLDAIRYHTSGRAKMSNLEKLIFVADMVEEGRTYLGVEKLRKAFYEDDFEKAFIQCLKEEVLHLLNKKQYIYYRTLEAYEYYVNNKR